jgi:hypothetical protein
MVLMMLRLSIQHLNKCVRDITPLLTTRYEVNAVINCHVFSKPRANSHKFWWFLFVPAALSLWDLFVNIGLSGIVNGLFGNTNLLRSFYAGQTALTILLCIVSWLCFSTARSMDAELAKVDAMYPDSC